MIDNVTETETTTAPVKTAAIRKVKPDTKAAPAKPAPAAKTAPVTRTTTPSEGLSKLRVGDTFLRNKVTYAVYFLNESRACVAPINELSEYRKSDDGLIKFMVPSSGKTENIGPNSELDVVASLGREGLAKYIDERKAHQAEGKPAAKAKPIKAAKVAKAVKTAKTPKTPGTNRRSGSLGNYQGHSIASVIRTLAKKGWTFGELRAWLENTKIEASDQTIKLNIYRANHPERPDSGAHAPLKPNEMPTKPVIKATEKTPKAAAKTAPAKAKVAPAKAVIKTAPAPVAKKPAPGDRAAAQIAALKAAKQAKLAASAVID